MDASSPSSTAGILIFELRFGRVRAARAGRVGERRI
jgi:hypothetical protein